MGAGVGGPDAGGPAFLWQRFALRDLRTNASVCLALAIMSSCSPRPILFFRKLTAVLQMERVFLLGPDTASGCFLKVFLPGAGRALW